MHYLPILCIMITLTWRSNLILPLILAVTLDLTLSLPIGNEYVNLATGRAAGWLLALPIVLHVLFSVLDLHRDQWMQDIIL